jgi:hypothetical protein
VAEITWRWAFGAAAWLLIVFAVGKVLRGIDVSQAEILIARRSDAFLVADALARSISQALPAMGRVSRVLAPALALLWAVAATAGRAATLKALLEESPWPGKVRVGSLFALNLLRSLFTLAALAAFFGTLILSVAVISGHPTDPSRPAAAMMVGTFLAALVAAFWSIVNWFLSLAPIWIVQDGCGPLASIVASVSLYRRKSAAYFSMACAFGLLRAGVVIVAFVIALLAAAMVPAPNVVAGVILTIVISLGYFAVADFLAIARIAAFLELDAMVYASPVPSPVAQPEPLDPPWPTESADPSP